MRACRTLLLLGLCGITACSSTGTAPGPTPPATPAPAPEIAGSPAEQAWQLRFTLALTDDLAPPLQRALEERFGPPDGRVTELDGLGELQGAGYRIASRERILEATSDLAVLRQAAESDMRSRLATLEKDHPEALATLDEELLAEEILIVRSAVLDSLESLAAESPPGALPGLDSYREGTLRARNQLEYVVFAQDMDRLAERSIDDASGRLDAFHRLLEDGDEEAFLRERIMATEEMNRQLSDEHRDYATRRTVRTLFFMLPALSSYLRYR